MLYPFQVLWGATFFGDSAQPSTLIFPQYTPNPLYLTNRDPSSHTHPVPNRRPSPTPTHTASHTHHSHRLPYARPSPPTQHLIYCFSLIFNRFSLIFMDFS